MPGAVACLQIFFESLVWREFYSLARRNPNFLSGAGGYPTNCFYYNSHYR
jgi:hypothetical protein